MLEQILAFTLAVRDLDTSERAYREFLHLQPVARGVISAAQADAWAAPLTKGRRWVLLAGVGGRPAWLRLVEQRPVPGYQTLATLGWAAIEILVADPYALAARLAGSPFTVVVPPRPIPFDRDIHAMQAVGPDGEMLYLTRLPVQRVILDLHATTQPVERAFIAILAVRSLEASLSYYSSALRTAASVAKPTVVKVINDAYGLPDDHGTPLGIVKMPRDFLIEVDEYPQAAIPRQQSSGALPPGISMVTFAARAGDVPALPWRSAPARADDGPCAGHVTGVTVGPAGEWLELAFGASMPLG